MANKPNNAQVNDHCKARIRVLSHYAKASEKIGVNGKARTIAGVCAYYQKVIDRRARLRELRGALKAQLALLETEEAELRVVERAVKAWVPQKFGVESAEAHAFGCGPPRIAVRTVEDKKRAAEKAKATREARHTMGKRQKEKIHGVLPAEESDAGDAVESTSA